MNSRIGILLVTLLPALSFSQGNNIPDQFTILPDPKFKSLDEQVQSLKADVITLSQDLGRLQNNLEAPASSKVSIFVSLDPKTTLNVDAMQLQVDDRPVANYIYTTGEQEALHRGGVQRLYLGDINVGHHQLNASFIGEDTMGNEKRAAVSGNFEKSMAAKFIEIKITREAAAGPHLILKEWE